MFFALPSHHGTGETVKCRAELAARNLQLVANGLCGEFEMSLGCAGRSGTGIDLESFYWRRILCALQCRSDYFLVRLQACLIVIRS
jgi:hypothetical protein